MWLIWSVLQGVFFARPWLQPGEDEVVETVRVLVLNNTYEPINVCNARRAVRMMLLGKAETVESEDEFWIRSAT